MNAFERDCVSFREISRLSYENCEVFFNVNKFFILFLYFVITAYLLVYTLFYTDVVVACSLLYPLFRLMMLLNFCLFVDHVDKLCIFLFGTFGYHFNKTFSIFVTIFNCSWQPFSEDYDLTYHKTYVVCFYLHKWQAQQFIVTRNFSMQIFIYS